MASKDNLPQGRLARTARMGSMVAGQGARLVGTRVANLSRDEQAAAQASAERSVAIAEQVLVQLGSMKGAAMKVGQLLSTLDLPMIPPQDRERFKARLAALRDDVPPVPFARIEKMMRHELGEPVSQVFDDFETEAFAAASIGQVHRARYGGHDVVVKVQYPGIAEAVEADLRNLKLIVPLLRQLAPGLDMRALLAEMSERIREELDYELEASHQRAIWRATRGHPFVTIPSVHTTVSTRRILVSQRLEGMGFEEIKAADQATRDRMGEMVFRFFFGLLTYTRMCAADPHPGNYLLMKDGRLGAFDFGLTRLIEREYLEGEQELARAIRASDPVALKRVMTRLEMLPNPEQVAGEDLLAMLRAAGGLYFQPGVRQVNPEMIYEIMEATSPKSPYFGLMRHQSLPPQSLMIRKMEGLLLSVMGELRATNDWEALAAEYYARQEPVTEMGRADRAFWDGRA